MSFDRPPDRAHTEIDVAQVTAELAFSTLLPEKTIRAIGSFAELVAEAPQLGIIDGRERFEVVGWHDKKYEYGLQCEVPLDPVGASPWYTLTKIAHRYGVARVEPVKERLEIRATNLGYLATWSDSFTGLAYPTLALEGKQWEKINDHVLAAWTEHAGHRVGSVVDVTEEKMFPLLNSAQRAEALKRAHEFAAEHNPAMIEEALQATRGVVPQMRRYKSKAQRAMDKIRRRQ